MSTTDRWYGATVSRSIANLPDVVTSRVSVRTTVTSGHSPSAATRSSRAAAQGHRVAIGALVRGLRRRLAVSTDRVAARDDWRPWLAGLAHHAPNTQVRDAAERLERLADHPESETAVLSAANAVEDVWHSLRP